jgi:hypothetical protein
MIAPCGRRKIRWIETIQAVNLTSPPKGKVLAMALVMHSYLPNLAGLPICLEISKFLKKNWSKTCNFGMVWWEIFLPSPRRQHFRENFFRCPFQYPKVPAPRSRCPPPNLLMLPTPLARVVATFHTTRLHYSSMALRNICSNVNKIQTQIRSDLRFLLLQYTYQIEAKST